MGSGVLTGALGAFVGTLGQGAAEPWRSGFVDGTLSPKTCDSPVRPRDAVALGTRWSIMSLYRRGWRRDPGLGELSEAAGWGRRKPSSSLLLAEIP